MEVAFINSLNEGLDDVVGVDLEDGDGNFLAARSGERDVDVAGGIERGIGDGMKIFGDGDADLDGLRIADVAVGGDDDWSGDCAFGDARDEKRVRADDEGSFDFAELDFGTVQVGRAEAGAGDADLASGKSERRHDTFNARRTVHVFLAQDAVGESHLSRES